MAEGSRAKAGGEGSGYHTFGGNSEGGSSGGGGRAWRELLDRHAFAKPSSFKDARTHIKLNLSYFRRNYAIFMLVVLALSLLWRPISLIVLAVLVAAWIYLYFSRSGPLVVLNRPIGQNYVLAIMSVVTIVALAFTPGAGITILVSLVVSFGVVCLHGAFRTPNDLFLEQQDHAALVGNRNGGSRV